MYPCIRSGRKVLCSAIWHGTRHHVIPKAMVSVAGQLTMTVSVRVDTGRTHTCVTTKTRRDPWWISCRQTARVIYVIFVNRCLIKWSQISDRSFHFWYSYYVLYVKRWSCFSEFVASEFNSLQGHQLGGSKSREIGLYLIHETDRWEKIM